MSQPIRFLFFGAGVIGSLHAAKLALHGHDVTILARGKRLEEIRERGLVIEEMRTKKRQSVQVKATDRIGAEDEDDFIDGKRTQRRETATVKVTDRIGAEDEYDFIVVAVRNNQVHGVLPLLSEARSGTVVFMVNRALGYDDYTAALGRERVVIAFPASAGTIENGVVRYYVPGGLAKLAQSTTFGELDGTRSDRVRLLSGTFANAGFNTAISANMDAWQKSHVVVVGCIAAAVYLHGGSNYELARSREGVRLMIAGIREGFAVLEKLGYAVTPSKLRMLERMPGWILVPFFRRVLATELAEIVIAFHAGAAKDEMKALADELDVLIAQSGLSTPSIEALKRCYEGADSRAVTPKR